MATTKITKGASFKRAAEYDLTNGQKSKADRKIIAALPATPDESIVPGFKAGERARLLATNLTGETPRQLTGRFECVTAQKPAIKEPAHKVAVSAKPGEHLETHQWITVGLNYLKEMGYADSPYIIAQHREKDHEHIHILTSRVDFNGKVISDFCEQKRARKWAMSIEEKYDLQRTPKKHRRQFLAGSKSNKP